MQMEFKNLREVSDYLRKEGWQVSQSTVYKHGNDGKIRPDVGTAYSYNAVKRYASRYLIRAETKLKINDEELQRKKTIAEVARITEQAKLAQIKRMAEVGKYILRSDLFLEMAARAAILEAGLKYMINSRAADWIEAVDGDQKKVGDLIRIMENSLNRGLNEFASITEFQVVFDFGLETEKRE